MSKEDNIIRLDDAQLREHLYREISESVEDTLNSLLDADTGRLYRVGRYERSADLDAAKENAADVVNKLKSIKLPKAAQMVEKGIEETLHYMNFFRKHWRSLKTNNPLER